MEPKKLFPFLNKKDNTKNKINEINSEEEYRNSLILTIDDLKGEWFDIHSEYKLSFNKNKLSIVSPKEAKQFQVKILVDEKGDYYVVNIKKNELNFGNISKLRWNNGGKLIGYNINSPEDTKILEFVKEEVLIGENKIKDNSLNLTKKITSTQISSFQLSFSTAFGRKYDLDDFWSMNTNYNVNISINDFGKYELEYTEEYENGKIYRILKQLDIKYLHSLDKLIKESNILENNGYQFKNNVNKPGYLLYVEYESEEIIKINTYGDAADTCIFAIKPFLDILKDLIK